MEKYCEAASVQNVGKCTLFCSNMKKDDFCGELQCTCF